MTGITRIYSDDGRDWFRDAVREVLQEKGIEHCEETEAYLVNLLADYRHSHRFFDELPHGRDLQPLAIRFFDAMQSPDRRIRRLSVRRVGDVALFVSAFFAGSFRRKPVTVDYYRDMGSMAYGWLADSDRDPGWQRMWRELAGQFGDIATALTGIRGGEASPTLPMSPILH